MAVEGYNISVKVLSLVGTFTELIMSCRPEEHNTSYWYELKISAYGLSKSSMSYWLTHRGITLAKQIVFRCEDIAISLFHTDQKLKEQLGRLDLSMWGLGKWPSVLLTFQMGAHQREIFLRYSILVNSLGLIDKHFMDSLWPGRLISVGDHSEVFVSHQQSI